VKVVATYNLKGGVGKTSAAVNVGALAARAGLRTLLWDLDPQGAATYMLRVHAKVKGGGRKLVRGRSDLGDLLRGSDVEGLDLLPADFTYRNLDLVLDDLKKPLRRLGRTLEPVAGDYDLAVLDCAPAISLTSESVFDAADALLVPLVPATLSVRAFDQLTAFLATEVARPPQVVAFCSMVDTRKKLHREIVEQLQGQRPEVVRTVIPAAADVERMAELRAPVADFARTGRPAAAYAALWDELRERLEL
jgi:chromosome partitioning protein